MQYNLLTVPRGSQIASIVLADGSKVFLNSASSLKYPVAFTGNERRVEITGEVYFRNCQGCKKRKFIVVGGGIQTEVLGTHFNMNTYGDDETMKVTLLEGSVKVSSGLSGALIKPGSQAAFKNGILDVNKSVDVGQVLAWKNGVFNFQNNSLAIVMRQLSRWYDIDVVYPKGVPGILIGGKIPRSIPLSEMLDALGAVGVKFEIRDKKLIVLP